ncbi:right-handed parallel beta-helix repeat-containing protein [Streptomyces sp. NRRL B-1140]|uniref:right-handed parallel beta-helix repeat-containing protein n=1 Tax=Streptomyces sp. NRRL B-1140 TaxID=1415549 RepID=UPI000AA7B48C|nr:right-handed parallel beta-helix repeat-containing protein [Streptomyces sp. NRRL B-1140]
MKRTAVTAAITAVLLATAAPGAIAHASAPVDSGPAEYTVDTTSDAVDADGADGRCLTDSGRCSLRAAVMAANARPGSTITLPPGHYRLTIPPDPRLIIGDHPDPTTGDLNVAAPVTIKGSGARTTVIDANRLDRAFRMQADSRLSDLTITGGVTRQRELPITDTGGGAIANGHHMTLRRVTVTGNSAGYGGGVFNVPDSHLDLIDSTVSGNTAGEAGGIRFDDTGTVTNSTIADNRVTNPGDRPGSLAGYGGGIDIRGTGAVEILNSTITGNRSSDGGGGINIAPAYLDSLPAPIPDIVDLPLGRLTLRNSVIANNTVDGAPADCKKAFATIASQGHNLDGDGSCRLTAAGDLPSRSPLTGPLTDNGGPTDTVALLPGSPALDTADGCPGTDQRGVARPQGAACDMGAYEAETP